jgi:uncharacterized membrane protein YkvA (DUF1232 family)
MFQTMLNLLRRIPVVRDFELLLKMVLAHRTKRFVIANESIVIATCATIYVISPLDIIPNVIPFVGWVDDVTVIAYTTRTLKLEITRFKVVEEDVPSIYDMMKEVFNYGPHSTEPQTPPTR